MLDCSRNAVYTLDALKKFALLLSKMGYNYLQLYTEDTYEVQNEPYFGYLRGKYTESELKEFDAYCASLGIELIPCVQTLAHLGGITRWDEYKNNTDCGDILLVDSERTYELVENIFASCASAFTSRRIHIGMDEAHMVGLGKYLDEHGYHNRTEILVKHLTRVCEIAEKYGFKPMMWSDMFFRLATNGVYNVDEFVEFSKEVIEKVPKNLELVYWDYYAEKSELYNVMIKSHQQFGNKIVFAGGAWCWSGIIPSNKASILRNELALRACEENGIDDAMITIWGDDGAEFSLFSVLPALYSAALNAQGCFDTAKIKEGFKELTGIAFDDFTAIDDVNFERNALNTDNPSKYMLFNDPFLGVCDRSVNAELVKEFDIVGKKMQKLAKDKNFGYVFGTAAELCSVLSIKYDLGVRTRKIYRSGTPEQLAELIEVYKDLEKRVKKLYKAFLIRWDKECKFNGFEHHDVRFGGLILRIRHCTNLLKKYASGKIKTIPALEEDIFPLFIDRKDGTEYYNNDWLSTVFIKPKW